MLLECAGMGWVCPGGVLGMSWGCAGDVLGTSLEPTDNLVYSKQALIKADSGSYIISHAHILLICLSCLAFSDGLKLSARWSRHNSPEL